MGFHQIINDAHPSMSLSIENVIKKKKNCSVTYIENVLKYKETPPL